MLDHMTADMTDDVMADLDVEETRDRAPEGYPALPDLPLGRYTDPCYYAAEMHQVFRRSWLFVGHESELPDEGSYIVADIPFAPVVPDLSLNGRFGRVEEIAQAVMWLSSPQSSYTCGHLLAVDGGYLAR